jgi:hypothetical protein
MRAAGKPVAGFPGGIGDVGTRAPHDGMGGDVSECGMGVLRSGGVHGIRRVMPYPG